MINKELKIKALSNQVKADWESFPKTSPDPIEDFKPIFKSLLDKYDYILVDEEQFVSNALDAYQEALSDEFCDMGNDLLDFILDKMLSIRHQPDWKYESLLKLVVK